MKLISHSVFYEYGTEQKEKYLNKVEKQIKKEGNTLLNAMLKEVEKTVTNYKSDFLVHDVNRLQESKSKYVWLVHKCGTFLIKLDHDYKENAEDMEDWLKNVNRLYEDKSKYYIVDAKNSTLKQVKKNHKDINFTFKYEDKDSHFEKVAGGTKWELVKKYREKKKQIKTEKEMIDFIRKNTLKAI